MKKILKICLSVLVLLNSGAALAKKKTKKITQANPRIQTSLIVDANTGKILHNVNGHQKIYPASLTKLMTLYMAFDAIKNKKLKLDDQLNVSYNAEKMKPCKLGLRVGEKITTRDAILALIVKSANDAAVVIGEAIAKDETSFAKIMTKKAHQLGMKNTYFHNASGWHHPDQKTTATDLAKLTFAIKRDFPQFYPWFSKDSFTFNGRTINGHNRVTKNYPGAEGMKTGYTGPAGFNLVTTASRNGKSLIGVVTGSGSASSRDQKMMALLDTHFGDAALISDVFGSSNQESRQAKQKQASKKPILLAKAKAKPAIQGKKYSVSKKLAKAGKKIPTLKRAVKTTRTISA